MSTQTNTELIGGVVQRRSFHRVQTRRFKAKNKARVDANARAASMPLKQVHYWDHGCVVVCENFERQCSACCGDTGHAAYGENKRTWAGRALTAALPTFRTSISFPPFAPRSKRCFNEYDSSSSGDQDRPRRPQRQTREWW